MTLSTQCTCPNFELAGVTFYNVRNPLCPVHGDEARAREIADAVKPLADAAVKVLGKMKGRQA